MKGSVPKEGRQSDREHRVVTISVMEINEIIGTDGEKMVAPVRRQSPWDAAERASQDYSCRVS